MTDPFDWAESSAFARTVRSLRGPGESVVRNALVESLRRSGSWPNDDEDELDELESQLVRAASSHRKVASNIRRLSTARPQHLERAIRRSRAIDATPTLGTIVESVRLAQHAPADRVEAWLDAKLVHPDEKLKVGAPALLSVGLKGEIIAEVDDDALWLDFPEGVDQLTLQISLVGEHFRVEPASALLIVERSGESSNSAIFSITPKRRGVLKLSAFVHCGNSYLQEVRLTFRVGTAPGAAVTATTVGRSLASAPGHSAVQAVAASPDSHDVASISVYRGERGRYWARLTAEGFVLKERPLGIDVCDLSALMQDVRRALNDIVTDPVLQNAVDLPESKRDDVLRKLARVGSQLFRTIFEDGDARELGEYIAKLVTGSHGTLTLQLVSEDFGIPWTLMYVADGLADDEPVELDRFVGMSCIVEQLPPVDTPRGKPILNARSDGLAMSFNVNTNIDEDFGASYIADQQAFWSSFSDYSPPISVTDRTQSKEFIAALKNTSTTDQVIYLFCHAESNDKYPSQSFLELSDASVSADDLAAKAKVTKKFPNHPLVVINACESGQLSPILYEGFLPYFVKKGAVGVIGTESKIPAVFASAWGIAFLSRLFTGEELGRIMLDLRLEFMNRGNPLGLAYGCYSGATTRLDSAITRS